MSEEMTLNPGPATVILDPDELRLKAERVQLRLQGMPAWTLLPNGRSIRRTRNFKEVFQAEEFSAFVARITLAERQPVTIDLVECQVVVILHGLAEYAGELTEEVLDMADAIG